MKNSDCKLDTILWSSKQESAQNTKALLAGLQPADIFGAQNDYQLFYNN